MLKGKRGQLVIWCCEYWCWALPLSTPRVWYDARERGHVSTLTLPQSFCHTLYQVAAHPEYAKVLREEVESIVKHDGWTKESMDKMYKVDSMLKECLRWYSVGAGQSDLPDPHL